jgi:hypothetical protein
MATPRDGRHASFIRFAPNVRRFGQPQSVTNVIPCVASRRHFTLRVGIVPDDLSGSAGVRDYEESRVTRVGDVFLATV